MIPVIEIPAVIPPGTKIVSKQLADGNMAVKLNLDGDRKYGVYSKNGVFLGELLTFDEVQARS